MNRITEWRHKRMLKGLGTLEPQHVDQAIAFMERRQNDAMPGLILMPRPTKFQTTRWLTGYRELPEVRGRLKGGVK